MRNISFILAVVTIIMCHHNTSAKTEDSVEIGKFFQKIFDASMNQIQKGDLDLIESAIHELKTQSEDAKNCTLQVLHGLDGMKGKLDEGKELDRQRDEKLKGDLSQLSNLQNELFAAFTAESKAKVSIDDELKKLINSLTIIREERENDEMKKAVLKQELLCFKYYAFYNVTNIINVGKKRYFLKPDYDANHMFTWAKSKSYCEERRASLVTIESKSELVSLSHFITNTYKPHYGFWLSATKDGTQEGRYMWPNGKIIEKGHEWWSSAYPVDNDGSEHCVGLFPSLASLFDYSCSSVSNVICELTSECRLD
ncbi:uncharacterized protein LOC132200054 [Neocloeon triangulifer]|uniref:uncharacterized protein LOC132200054 n=1 Tax=Neocloeon triangulifer TaxID=2078957 RepID=UPI00286F4EF6|nr:uncharacterized protein LOC132200054 [Neocloeon triangulifer]